MRNLYQTPDRQIIDLDKVLIVDELYENGYDNHMFDSQVTLMFCDDEVTIRWIDIPGKMQYKSDEDKHLEELIQLFAEYERQKFIDAWRNSL